jgi:hypothetical protein
MLSGLWLCALVVGHRAINRGEPMSAKISRGSSHLGVAALHFRPSCEARETTLFLFRNIAMRHYSAFQLDPTGHVAGRIDLNCIDDEDAKRQAEMLVEPCGLELWEDDRMIAVVRKKKPS